MESDDEMMPELVVSTGGAIGEKSQPTTQQNSEVVKIEGEKQEEGGQQQDKEGKRSRRSGDCDVVAPAVPVTIVTGWLGSGKTTFLRNVLERLKDQNKQIAIIQNEASGVGIEDDLKLVDDDGNAVADLKEIGGGCVCCSVRSDFVSALEVLLRTRKFDHIFVECSGVADPGKLASMFWLDDSLEGGVFLNGVIGLVDARLTSMNGKDKVAEATRNQIAYADIIILNKKDLVQEDRIKRLSSELEKLNPVPLLVTIRSKVADLKQILDLDAYNPSSAENIVKKQQHRSHDQDSHHHHHDQHHHHHHDQHHHHHHHDHSKCTSSSSSSSKDCSSNSNSNSGGNVNNESSSSSSSFSTTTTTTTTTDKQHHHHHQKQKQHQPLPPPKAGKDCVHDESITSCVIDIHGRINSLSRLRRWLALLLWEKEERAALLKFEKKTNKEEGDGTAPTKIIDDSSSSMSSMPSIKKNNNQQQQQQQQQQQFKDELEYHRLPEEKRMNIMRMKGLLSITPTAISSSDSSSSSSRRKYYLQGVQQLFEITQGPEWKNGDEYQGTCRVVCIGQRLDKDFIAHGLRNICNAIPQE